MMACMSGSDARNEWTRPGLYEVAPGVHRIPLPLPNDGLAAVNAYAVVDGDQLALIDPGWGLTEARERLAEALAGLGAGFGDVTQFLVTHQHRDHYTQAVLLRREFGIRVSLGAQEKEALQILNEPTPAGFFPHVERITAAGAGELLPGIRAGMAAHPHDPDLWEMPDAWLTDGQDVRLADRHLQVIATPGHTRGHVVFRDEPANLLFAGDHVLPHITPSVGFEVAPAELALRDYLKSLTLVRALPDTRLLPAHGPVTESAHARIDELLEHHDTRLALILDTIAKGASTAYEAAGRITWTRRERRLDELTGFNMMLAIMETDLHLHLLVVQGRLAVQRIDGVDHYTTA
jgi:glyoxylase-like metal-dependent hydrolase (beta-lactamase superfamily II)